MAQLQFYESYKPDEEWSHMYADVYVHPQKDFITVETDPSEGQAMMTLSLAKKVHESLGRAIKFAEGKL